jgi:3-hydroxyacyl-[acyl-carrier-protein] dehydratase
MLGSKTDAPLGGQPLEKPLAAPGFAAGGPIEIDEILRLLPHRYPFLLIDRAFDYVPMHSIRGIKAVTFNEQFFQGHFPGRPMMPGVLQIEAMAQTGAVLISKSLNVDVQRHTVFFMSVDGVKFRQPVGPGDLLEMRVEVLFARRGIFKFSGLAEVRGVRASEAVFAAKAVELP